MSNTPTPNFTAAIAQLKVLRRRLPRRVANAALRHFLDSFRKQGFVNESISPWQGASKKKYSAKKSTGILIASGALRASLRVSEATMEAIKIAAGNDKVKYAQLHNEGFEGTVTVKAHERQKIIRKKVRGSFQGTARKKRTQVVEINGTSHLVKSHSRKMKIPRRQFIGVSARLGEQIDRIIIEEIKQLEAAAFKTR
ncbi:phage virion morphogenesis protein [Nodularia spumigena]|jgi:phage gpG-like protein|uniref:phage virion morphogenesis protein n=1 Tax=Nodularia spumigena TaxID=70799 RepID=UPI00233082FF|nr:phage virion morphogenesis protein [Nodularia spumigena]MDB9498583.1 phage virion morphogenesis protein [Nodularia spumigena CS-336/02]